MAVPFSENGGFAATTFFMMVPTLTSDSGAPFISVFDPTNFDDPDDSSSYTWRAEDIAFLRVPTVRRVGLVYTDLGIATIKLTLTGTNDNNAVVTASKSVSIGTVGATNAQLTALVDITLTAFRPQLKLDRAKGAGPVSIVSVSLIGEVEEVTL